MPCQGVQWWPHKAQSINIHLQVYDCIPWGSLFCWYLIWKSSLPAEVYPTGHWGHLAPKSNVPQCSTKKETIHSNNSSYVDISNKFNILKVGSTRKTSFYGLQLSCYYILTFHWRSPSLSPWHIRWSLYYQYHWFLNQYSSTSMHNSTTHA